MASKITSGDADASSAEEKVDEPPVPPRDPFEPATTNTLALLSDETPLDFFLNSLGLYLYPGE